MRFETAIAAFLAAENFSSLGVAAQEDLSGRDIQEKARLREEAVKAFSNRYPGDHRSLQESKEKGPRRHLIGDNLRKLTGKRLEKLKNSVKQEQRKRQRQLTNKNDSSTSSESDPLDLGILPPKQTKKQLEKKLLSNIEKLQQKTKEATHPGANSNDVAPDLGILPSVSAKKKSSVFANKIKKLVEAAKPESRTVGSSGDLSISNPLLDLGIISSQTTEQESREKFRSNAKTPSFHEDDRRLEDNFDFQDNLDAPLAFMVQQVCVGAIQYCDSCEVTFVDETNVSAGYSVDMKCVAPEGYADDTDEILTSFTDLCSYGLCQTKCDVDKENFVVDMRDCSVSNVDGLQEELPNIFDEVGQTGPIDMSGLGDISLNNILATSLSYTCDILAAAEVFNEGGTPFCNICEVTYLPAIGDDIEPYNIEIDCPNFPEEQDDSLVDSFADFDDLCSSGFCESCDVDSQDFKLELKNCSFSFYADGILGGYSALNQNFTFINPDMALAGYSQGFFDNYFSSLCNSEDIICGACGTNPEDDSVLSFELDCPAVLNTPDSIFGDYFYYATILCYKPEILGLQCSTCEVDPFEATINIGDCVTLTTEEVLASASEVTAERLSDEVAFSTLYSETCYGGSAYYYLQEFIEEPDCACKFNASAKTASITCQQKENCREFPSYCGSTLEFCDSYVTTASLAKDKSMSLQRCETLSSGIPNNDMFQYCVNFAMENDIVNGTTSRLVPGCEMEVEGVSCNSCSLGNSMYSGSQAATILAFMDSNIYYNCNNSVIGANGNGNLSDYQLIQDTFQFFIYGTLPCEGGCDLCGTGDGMAASKSTFMTIPDGVFATEKWKENAQDRCFDAQLDAMTLKQPLTKEECQQMRDVVREPCGCKNPNPPPVSSGNRFSAMNSILFTFAAASLIQIFIG
eukprot:CAMPEP_0116141710 /NCGR_PEP_ID=MMETSP0329-20121206/14523_1 /TAXON_ID=697910 /ORGANISM="Pseudo-nitzschia arenysensis, Strain B593" /LENGTH=913 /DNA_ID=CAMNT_0003636903 /DNA_START=125 /DNA_END=2866 /DNA_ORIENTATION=-